MFNSRSNKTKTSYYIFVYISPYGMVQVCPKDAKERKGKGEVNRK